MDIQILARPLPLGPLPLGLPHNARYPRLEKGQKGEASGGVLGASGFLHIFLPWDHG